MSTRDPNTIDLTQATLRLADDIVVWPVSERGQTVYRIEIPSLHKFFRVGYEEYVFISLLDGKTTLAQACGLAARQLGSDAPTSKQADSIQRWLLQNGLAYLPQDAPPVRDTRLQATGHRTWANLNPFWMKFSLPASQRVLAPLAKRLKFLFNPLLVSVGLAVIAAAIFILCVNWKSFSESAKEIISLNNWAWLLGTWVALKVVHELAHAIACYRHGGVVRESGVVLVLFAPLAYVDVTSCWRMNSRWARIAVAAAGMYVELVIAALAIIAWTFVDSASTKFFLYNLVLSAGLSTVLFNANALMRFDGYFILADLIDVPNLYAEGSQSVRRIARRLVLGLPSGKTHLVGWRRHLATAYGFASCIWRVTICVTLAITAATMFAGAGIAIAALGVVMWLGKPTRQVWTTMSDLYRQDRARFVRALVVSSGLLGGGWLLFWKIPLPTAVHAPTVAMYRPETIVRSQATGFIRAVHVHNQQEVKQGDLLIELENRELVKQYQQLKLTIEQNEIRLRKAAGDQDPSLQWVLKQNRVALDEQLDQLQPQVDGLSVLAPRDGFVVQRDLAMKVNSYVHEGDALLVVASHGDKELIALVDQDSIDQVRSSIGTKVPIRTASYEVAQGTLGRIEPRGTLRLPNPSLAAAEGGPLEVRRVDEAGLGDQAYQLLTPHFQARLEVSPDVAQEIPAGMRMTTMLGYQNDPMATRIKKTVRRLWHEANQQQ